MTYLRGKAHLFWRQRPNGAEAEICGAVRLYAAPGRLWILPIPRAEERVVAAFYGMQLLLALVFGSLWFIGEVRGVAWGDWLLYLFLIGEGLLLLAMFAVLGTKGFYRRRDAAWLDERCRAGGGLRADDAALQARREEGVDGEGKRIRLRLPLADGEAVLELGRRQHRSLLVATRGPAPVS